MHLQVVTSRAGQGTCPACHEVRQLIALNVTNNDESRGVRVCENCISMPGVSFGIDFNPPPTTAVRTGKRRLLTLIKNEERQTAREIGGRKTRASGALDGDGDSKNERWMVEEKHTEAGEFRLKMSTISKAMAQAARQGKDWVIKLRLPKLNIILAIMRWESALSLVNGNEDEATDER